MKEPPRKEMTLRLPASLREKLREYAHSHGVTNNSVVCLALAKYLRVEEEDVDSG